MRHLIKNACVLTVNGTDEVFDPGFVLIEGERIAAVGPMSAAPPGPFDRETDAGGDFLTPGFVNLHEHEHMHLMKGVVEGILLEPWVMKISAPSRNAMDDGDITCAHSLAALEMLRTGTTCALIHPSRAAQLAQEDGAPTPNQAFGLRVSHGIAYQIRTPNQPNHPFGPAEADADLRQRAALYAAAPGQINLVTAIIECNAHHTQLGRSSDELVMAGNAVTRELGLPIASHLSGGTLSMSMGFLKYKRATGRSDVEYLERLGVLDQRWMLVHGIHFTDHDIDIIAKRGASVVYTPTSENSRGGGIGPWVQMRDAGILCAMGTDGPAVDYSMDMVEQTKAAILFQNVRHRGPASMSSRFALRMSTLNGAKALGAGDWLGSIEAGKRADLVLFARRRAAQWLAEDPVDAFVMGSHGTDARLVLVNGAVSYEDGRFRDGIDPAAIIAEARDRAASLHRRTGLDARAIPVWPGRAA